MAHLRHPYNDVKEAALDAAIAVGTDTVVRCFLDMSVSAEPVVRFMALYGLGQIDVRAMPRNCCAACPMNSPDVRKICLESLGSQAHDPRIFSALIGLAATRCRKSAWPGRDSGAGLHG